MFYKVLGCLKSAELSELLSKLSERIWSFSMSKWRRRLDFQQSSWIEKEMDISDDHNKMVLSRK